jgi:ADP-ribose pyrophosphatase YjhB (NUDIX family)
MSSSHKFSVVASNQYGDPCYAADSEGDVTLDDLAQNAGVWTVERPPAGVTIPGAVRRTYHDIEFLMSPKAADVIPSEHCSTGAQVVVKFGDYYALVTDNKPYWMPPAGSMDESDESAAACALRELREELAISDVAAEELVEVGSFSFEHQNRLIGSKPQRRTTIVYYLQLDQGRAEHLNMSCLFATPDDHMQMTEAKDLECDLNETQGVILIESGFVACLPTTIVGKRFDGHHRKTLCIIDGDHEAAGKIDCAYLSSYEVMPPKTV